MNIFSLVQQRTYVDTLLDSRIRSTQSQIMTCCRGAVLRRHMLLRAMLRIFCRSYPHVDQLCPSALRVSPASGVFVSCFFYETELQRLRHQRRLRIASNGWADLRVGRVISFRCGLVSGLHHQLEVIGPDRASRDFPAFDANSMQTTNSMQNRCKHHAASDAKSMQTTSLKFVVFCHAFLAKSC